MAGPSRRQVPDPGRHRTHFCAHYANRVRGERPGDEEPHRTDEAEQRRGAVARLAIRQMLDHLDLSPPEKPPPETRDVVRVPVDDEGREIEVRPP